MPELVPLLTENEIKEKVKLLSRQISADYQQKKPVLIGVLKGAFIFMGDLVRCLTIPVEIDFIQLSSYGKGDASSGTVKLWSDISTDIRNKDILIIEDIIDTGLTVNQLIDHLKTYGPRSIRVCTFIDKQERREVACPVDYAGHAVEGGFLVGYGLDYAEQYRNLPALYHLNL